MTKTSPYGSPEDSLDVLPILLAYDVSFVARTSSLQIKEMSRIIAAAMIHPGLAVVHILSPCVTYPVLAWKELRERLTPLSDSHSPSDKSSALRLAYTLPFYRGSNVDFGQLALKALEACWLTNRLIQRPRLYQAEQADLMAVGNHVQRRARVGNHVQCRDHVAEAQPGGAHRHPALTWL